MGADELTAAEGRVRRCAAGENRYKVYELIGQKYPMAGDLVSRMAAEDEHALAAAYLAEHDPTQVDGPALLAAGFRADGSGDGYDITLADGSHLELWADDAGEYAVTLTAHPELTRHADDVSGEIRLPAVRTRGQLAALRRGLGITSKGTA